MSMSFTYLCIASPTVADSFIMLYNRNMPLAVCWCRSLSTWKALCHWSHTVPVRWTTEGDLPKISRIPRHLDFASSHDGDRPPVVRWRQLNKFRLMWALNSPQTPKKSLSHMSQWDVLGKRCKKEIELIFGFHLFSSNDSCSTPAGPNDSSESCRSWPQRCVRSPGALSEHRPMPRSRGGWRRKTDGARGVRNGFERNRKHENPEILSWVELSGHANVCMAKGQQRKKHVIECVWRRMLINI